jgi:hypothetical protein
VSYPQQGYPQQPPNYQQPGQYQQQPGYPQQPPGYPQPGQPRPVRTNPATALVAAVFALCAAGALAVVGYDFLTEVPDGAGFGDLPGRLQAIPVMQFGAAVLLLIGAILLLARKMAGAVVVVLGGLAGVAAILLVPMLADIGMGVYLELVFKFDSTGATMSAIALILSPLALIVAILPVTLRHLRGAAADGYPEPLPNQPTW